MALPTSGPISASMIRAEFEQTGAMSLSSYYRGGGIVPDIPQNLNVPTFGTISYSNFYGAELSSPFDSLAPFIGVSNFEFPSPGTIGAGIQFQSNGNVDGLAVGTNFFMSPPASSIDWYDPNTPGIGSNFQIRLTVNSGSSPNIFFGGTDVGSWWTLNVDRGWRLDVTGTGASSGQWFIQIRNATSPFDVVASTTVNVNVESN